MNRLLLVVAVSGAMFASCSPIWRTSISDNLNLGVRLAEATADDGTRNVWRVYPGDDDNRPRIEKTTTKTEVVPDVGMTVSALNRERAEASGVTPFRGVWVERVTNGKPADRAGIVRGDIVMQVDGQDVASAEQFADLVASRGAPDQPLPLTVRMKRKPGTAIENQEAATVAVTPIAAKVHKSSTDSIPLEASKGVLTYAGLQLASLEPDLTRSIYGTNTPALLITGVVTGSPAYYAGLRAGDRVVKVDQRPVESMQDVRDAVLARIQSANPSAATYDLAVARSGTAAGPGPEGEIAFEVDGPLGAHQASVPIGDAVDGSSQFYIPILIDYESQPHRTEFGFLNFILQFGFNYDSRVRPSATREPLETSRLSILPLGMFEVHHGVGESHYTLFWFIKFSSKG
jgi:hypothetical protein